MWVFDMFYNYNENLRLFGIIHYETDGNNFSKKRFTKDEFMDWLSHSDSSVKVDVFKKLILYYDKYK